MATFDVAEKFTSINGEGRKAGQLAVFIRFKGCNLNCDYCDTKWANAESAQAEKLTENEITEFILSQNVKNVTLTGGEPLLRNDLGVLLETLAKRKDISVEIETNGSVDITRFDDTPYRPSFTMDYKLPSSGMEEKMLLSNIEKLRSCDTLKFVCGGKEDLDKAREIINAYNLTTKCAVYLSPVFGKINPADMVEYMKENNMNYVNLQLQIHKFIWEPTKRGV